MNLGFVCEWNKDRIKTWSSTPYSLYNALKKIDNINITDINVKNSFSNYQFHSFVDSFYRQYLQIKLTKQTFAKKLDSVLQIGDIGVVKPNYYLYQDLSMNLLINLYYNRPEVYKYSGFQDMSIEKLKKRLYYQLKIYEKCSGVFVFSNYLASILESEKILPKNKIHVVYSGINVRDKSGKEEKITNDRKNILFVGRDFYRKGGDLLIEAFKIIRKEYSSEVNLIIAGPQKWPMDGDIPEGVIFLGDSKWEVLEKYYKMSDVFCLPSRFEAFGIAIAEALCFGIPCVVRNDFAMNEIIQQDKNGYLINKDDKHELAENLIKTLENENMKKFVKDNCKNYRQKYSWDTVAVNMVNIMNKCK